MKIKNFKTLIYEFPLKEKVVTSFGEMDSRPALILEATTTDNIKGYGEIWCNWPVKSANYKVNLVHKVFKYFIQDIKFDSPKSFYNQINDKLSIMISQTGDTGTFQNIIAGFDIAIWDIFGKKIKKPINQIINKNANFQVNTYASGINPINCKNTILNSRKNGFNKFKLKIGFNKKNDLKNIDSILEILKKDEELIVDVNQGWDFNNCKKLLKEINQRKIKWIEEPILSSLDINKWENLSKKTLNSFACGENLRSKKDFEMFIKIKNIKYIQPDICKWGGFSEIIELNRIIKKYKKIYCPHFLGSGIGLIASAHLLSGSKSKGFLEIDINPNPLRSEFIKKELMNGQYFQINNLPGLGILKIPATIKKYIKNIEKSKLN